MKTFISNSLLSISFKCVFCIMIILFIIFLVVYPSDWFLFINILIISIFAFILISSSFWGFIQINDSDIYVPNDWHFNSERLQHKERIVIKDIVGIEFVEEDCKSNGKEIIGRHIGIPPYLKFYMADNSIKRILLYKFSRKTWIKIEKLIIEKNNDILVLTDARTFIKYLKTGIK